MEEIEEIVETDRIKFKSGTAETNKFIKFDSTIICQSFFVKKMMKR